MKIAKRNPFEGKPVIHTPDIFGATVGKDFFYRIPVTGKRPIEISINNTELELKNGLIYGNISECKKFEIEITAQNSCGAESKKLLVTIEKDGVLKTPLLGFTSWNAFGTKVKQEDIERTADLLIESGIADYGYSYLNLDSGWQSVYGGEFDAVMPNYKFPDMKKMCYYVHSKGLKCGTYSTPMLAAWGCPEGFESIPGTTQGERDPRYPRVFNGGIGLIHKESNNVKQWDAWGFDYLKYDWNIVDVENTELMKKELLGAKREYAYCVVTKAQHDDAEYLKENVNSWRCNQDSSPFWENMRARIDTVDIWADTVCRGHFYDLDMLTLGGYGEGEKKNELTQDEEIFLFTLVSFFMSPIQISTPIDKLDDFLLDLVCNEEILKINQDILANYPKLIKKNDDIRIYKRSLNDGDVAFAFFNINEEIITEAVELGGEFEIFDVWKKEYIGNNEILNCSVPSHGAVVYRIRRILI